MEVPNRHIRFFWSDWGTSDPLSWSRNFGEFTVMFQIKASPSDLMSIGLKYCGTCTCLEIPNTNLRVGVGKYYSGWMFSVEALSSQRMLVPETLFSKSHLSTINRTPIVCKSIWHEREYSNPRKQTPDIEYLAEALKMETLEWSEGIPFEQTLIPFFFFFAPSKVYAVIRVLLVQFVSGEKKELWDRGNR